MLERRWESSSRSFEDKSLGVQVPQPKLCLQVAVQGSYVTSYFFYIFLSIFFPLWPSSVLSGNRAGTYLARTRGIGTELPSPRSFWPGSAFRGVGACPDPDPVPPSPLFRTGTGSLVCPQTAAGCWGSSLGCWCVPQHGGAGCWSPGCWSQSPVLGCGMLVSP